MDFTLSSFYISNYASISDFVTWRLQVGKKSVLNFKSSCNSDVISQRSSAFNFKFEFWVFKFERRSVPRSGVPGVLPRTTLSILECRCSPIIRPRNTHWVFFIPLRPMPHIIMMQRILIPFLWILFRITTGNRWFFSVVKPTRLFDLPEFWPLIEH